MLPTKNYLDRPKTKSTIALMKIILKICTFSIKNHDFTTGTCGQDPMIPPPFFLTSIFFSYKQHFATFYVSLYDIYTINTIKHNLY